jgi:hypothetical protein
MAQRHVQAAARAAPPCRTQATKLCSTPACLPACRAKQCRLLFACLPAVHTSAAPALTLMHALILQVQGVQPVVLRGAAQQAAALEPGHGRLLPQLWRARDAGLRQELPAGVGGQHGGQAGGGGPTLQPPRPRRFA